MKITEDSKLKLEFSKVLRIFDRFMRSEIGELYIKGLKSFDDRERLLRRHELIRAFSRYSILYGDIPWNENLKPVDEVLRSAQSTSFLNGEELYRIRVMIGLALKIKNHFLEHMDSHSVLLRITGKIRDLSDELNALSVVDEHGMIADSSSIKLREIRTDLLRNRNMIRKIIAELTRDPQVSGLLQDRTTLIRNGRLVLPVKLEYINRFPGVAMDRSSTGSTVFMEHERTVPLNNKIAVLVSEERQECERILGELTKLVLKRRRAILEAQSAIGLADFLFSVISVIDTEGWVLPEISEKPLFELKKAIHPLLSSSPVPLDISCGNKFRLLVITGPNTGGKTVALKTVGLMVALAWHGLPLPVAEDSVIGNFSSMWMDIGDEQSIEQNLSTFSAHLKKVISILKNSDRRSLLLLDELGSGTDPQEGAALGIAILDALHERGSLTLATTHHNPIKRYAIGRKGVETASMEFDNKSLSPTYKLLMGIPGKSNAILIAGRMGMPEDILDRARQVRLGAEQSTEDLISELQEKQRVLDITREKLLSEREELTKMKNEYEAEMRDVEGEAERILATAEGEAEHILVKARETAKNMIKGLKGAAESAAHREMYAQNLEIGKQEKALSDKLTARNRKNRKSVDTKVDKPLKGDLVEISESGFKGTLSSMSGKRAVVSSGPMRMETTPDKIVLLKRDLSGNNGKVTFQMQKPANVPASIMVRGMTVDEALPSVARYLDQAMRSGYNSVMVIHGRGEGILRREVHNLCKTLAYVQDFRLGGPSEGGYGVTIVTFKK